jgi:hypothetical protein
VFARSAKNLDPDVSPRAVECERIANHVQHLRRFKAVREQFDPQGIYRNVIGEILGFY